jgi:hypothetical protein
MNIINRMHNRMSSNDPQSYSYEVMAINFVQVRNKLILDKNIVYAGYTI